MTTTCLLWPRQNNPRSLFDLFGFGLSAYDAAFSALAPTLAWLASASTNNAEALSPLHLATALAASVNLTMTRASSLGMATLALGAVWSTAAGLTPWSFDPIELCAATTVAALSLYAHGQTYCPAKAPLVGLASLRAFRADFWPSGHSLPPTPPQPSPEFGLAAKAALPGLPLWLPRPALTRRSAPTAPQPLTTRHSSVWASGGPHAHILAVVAPHTAGSWFRFDCHLGGN